MTDFDGQPQDLDEDEPVQDGPLRAWSLPPEPGTKYLGIKAAEIKPRGRTYKTASLRFFGDDPDNPSKARLEIKQCRKIPGNGYDFDNPERQISIAVAECLCSESARPPTLRRGQVGAESLRDLTSRFISVEAIGSRTAPTPGSNASGRVSDTGRSGAELAVARYLGHPIRRE